MRLLDTRRVRGALGVLALGLTGCGGAEHGAVTVTAQRFYGAVQAEDGAAACALLASSTRAELEQSAGEPCPAAILQERIPGAREPLDTDVFGTMAQVRYADETAFLARADTGWRVLAVACGGRPEAPERPFDCQVKGQ